jgi:hypothetical protein
MPFFQCLGSMLFSKISNPDWLVACGQQLTEPTHLRSIKKASTGANAHCFHLGMYSDRGRMASHLTFGPVQLDLHEHE